MIGIFDSGYGGLTIMKEVIKKLPEYDYVYLGDNGRAPYGNRSKETIIRYTDEAMKYLFERGARLIIVACYTASAQALRELQEKYLRDPKSPYKDRKILGVIRPVVEKAAMSGKIIGVTGTRATISSRALEMELHNLNPKLKVVSEACPLLVPLIEEGWHTKPEARMILRKYLQVLKSSHVDSLILGCTHYPLMIKDFKRIMGKRVRVLNSGEIVAESLVNYLERHSEIRGQLSKDGTKKFLTTDDPKRFEEFVKKFVGISSNRIEKISLI